MAPVVLHLDKRGHTIFTRNGIHFMFPAPPGEDTPGLHLVAMLPEEDPHVLFEVRFRADEGESPPEVGPVRDGGANGTGPGADHPEDRRRLHPVRCRFLDLCGDPVSILFPEAHVPERPPHLPPVKGLQAAVGFRDVLHQVGSQ